MFVKKEIENKTKKVLTKYNAVCYIISTGNKNKIKEEMKMKKFEIWAKFEDGLEVKVETHTSVKRAQNAIDAMNNHNRNDVAVGYGFPHGIPTYTIR